MSLGSHAACDGSQAHAATPDAAPTTPHAAWVLTTCILASSLAFIDGSAVNVGLPAIGHSLRAGAGDLQWVINAYLLPLSALLLFGGAAGDKFGRRLMLVLSTLAFGAASLGCALHVWRRGPRRRPAPWRRAPAPSGWSPTATPAREKTPAERDRLAHERLAPT